MGEAYAEWVLWAGSPSHERAAWCAGGMREPGIPIQNMAPRAARPQVDNINAACWCLKPEGAEGIKQASGVLEMHVVARGAVLPVSALQRISSETPAEMAVVRPPLRADIPEK